MKLKLLLLPVFFSAFFFIPARAQVDVGDSLALVDLYNSTGGSNWYYHYYWLSKKPVSMWSGVGVTGNRVTTLYLGGNNLRGGLPLSIGNLTALTVFRVESNYLQGTLPQTVGNFILVSDFRISDNYFTGIMPPSVGNLKSVVQFEAEENHFSGKIPSSFGSCKHLGYLNLDDNRFTGTLPLTLKYLKELTYLYAAHNLLSGPLPDIFDSEGPIIEINLSYNQFTGAIPDDIDKEKYSLHFLNLSYNQLSGELPESLSKLFKLYSLDLSHNNFSGNIPESLIKNYYVYQLFLTGNHFSQTYNISPDASFHYLASYLDSNNFTFNGLEYIAAKTSYHVYSPQASIPVHAGNGSLFLSAGGTLSNNTYHWFKAGTKDSIIVEGDSTFRPVTNGNYYAYVTNAIATDLILHTDTVSYTLPVKKVELNISISPNPARGVISIYGLDEKGNAKITIADMSGYVWIRAVSHQQSDIRCDVSRLKAGNYLVNVSDGKTTKTIQFVKE